MQRLLQVSLEYVCTSTGLDGIHSCDSVGHDSATSLATTYQRLLLYFLDTGHSQPLVCDHAPTVQASRLCSLAVTCARAHAAAAVIGVCPSRLLRRPFHHHQGSMGLFCDCPWTLATKAFKVRVSVVALFQISGQLNEIGRLPCVKRFWDHGLRRLDAHP